jgi:hypothetical protein
MDSLSNGCELDILYFTVNHHLALHGIKHAKRKASSHLNQSLNYYSGAEYTQYEDEKSEIFICVLL